jgi:hypothetical protein
MFNETALVICTKDKPQLKVLIASIKAYLPRYVTVFLCGSPTVLSSHRTFNLKNPFLNFGDAYNYAVNAAFTEFDNVVIANDDIVLNPNSWEKLLSDADKCHTNALTGWVAARSNYARGYQNIRTFYPGDSPGGMEYSSELKILKVPVIAPIFAHITKMAWVDFPPINWYSDDIQCMDMTANGFSHFISRAYVHHVGSASIGRDNMANHLEAVSWISENRKDFYDIITKNAN